MQDHESPPPQTSETAKPRKPATFLQIAGAVFWSFFGIRRGQDMRRDEVTIKPAHVIVVAVLFVAVFVVALVALARLISRSVGQP